MESKYWFLGLVAGTVVLLATGCSKQESPAAPAADSASKSPASVAAEKQPAVAAPKPTASPSAVPGSATNAVAAQPQKPATNQPVTAPAGGGGVVTGAPASTLQSVLRTQQMSLVQAATNQLRMLAAAGTNHVLAALATTNQVKSAATNQFGVLLERAKALSANQKYQEALTTVSQLYNTRLTPEQKQTVDDLKNRIQAALTQKAAAGASSALGNILGGSK